MTGPEIGIPGYLPAVAVSTSTAARSLALYRQLAEHERRSEEALRSAERRVVDYQRMVDRTLAVLASHYFEFERMVRRVRPELERCELAEAVRTIDLFARSWRQDLEREHVEVLDVTGLEVSGELAESIEVNASVPTHGATATIVRETIVPLVRHRGRVVGPAVVNTSVPLPPPVVESNGTSIVDSLGRNETQ